MSETYDFYGETYAVTDKTLRPFLVGVPHQRPAFVVKAEDSPPDHDEGDKFIEGDHDLSTTWTVDTLDDAKRLMAATNGGGQARHQAAKIAALVLEELVGQGVFEETD